MNENPGGLQRIFRSVIPAFLLAVSVGQIYAFTNFSSEIAEYIQLPQAKVQFAFSLGIFFLGMGAAFFGRIVEKNIKLSTSIGTVLFLAGMLLTAVGVTVKSLLLIYLGYGGLLGLGTGIIYISPVKTMMLWFPKNKALAAALPIISFGLGSTLSTLLFQFFAKLGITRVFIAYAIFYAPLMIIAALLLKKPHPENQVAAGSNAPAFKYSGLAKDSFFIQAWLFMFLNISAGLCLIPLAKQMMKSESVGYSAGLIAIIVGLCGLLNGGGRFVFAWASDRLKKRLHILLYILGISVIVMVCSIYAPFIGIALLVINACYGAGFSVIPAILADHYGMGDISKIHGAVLSAWGFAGLVGNQASLFVADKLGFGNNGVVIMLIIAYSLNLLNALAMNMRNGKQDKQ